MIERQDGQDFNCLQWSNMLKRITFGNYAGVNIPGTIPMELDVNKDNLITHAERASWLTAQVESDGKFGNVMNYDGTGLTAGIHQAVAVYPRDLNSTGSLWDLMDDIIKGCPPCDNLYRLLAEFEKYNIKIDRGLKENGKAIGGLMVRDILTGSPDGVMHVAGPKRIQAETFATLFHDLMSSPETFDIQVKFGIRHFTRWANRGLRFCKNWEKEITIKSFAYGIRDMHFEDLKTEHMSPSLDLAMSVFWSHTVNAPGMALEVFCKAADSVTGSMDLPPVLIKKLAITKYGRWDDDIPNGRYQRTRNFAAKIWPSELFVGDKAIMPKDFKD